jgi:hypothetical protein
LVETSLHQNQGCDSSGTGLKEYGTYHAWYNATKIPLEFIKEELLKLMERIMDA